MNSAELEFFTSLLQKSLPRDFNHPLGVQVLALLKPNP
jgi:hypothetical protein